MVSNLTQDNDHPVCPTCTWNEHSDCESCDIHGHLDCKWSSKLLLRFYKAASLTMLSAGVGLILVGLFISWAPLFVYLLFWIFFFGIFEIRVLCSHCPYYSQDGHILHCLANHGLIKVWPYRPEPLNGFEKAGFLLGALFFVIFPIIGEVYGILVLWTKTQVVGGLILSLTGLTGLSIIGGIIFFYVLQSRVCPHCVNFSCPLNRVPKEIADSYLRKNPVMRNAWLKSGYKFG